MFELFYFLLVEGMMHYDVVNQANTLNDGVLKDFQLGVVRIGVWKNIPLYMSLRYMNIRLNKSVRKLPNSYYGRG